MAKSNIHNKARSRGSEIKSKDLSESQRLKNENAELKRQLSRMRKQLSRINTDQFENLEDLTTAQSREESAREEIKKGQQIIEKWRCFNCSDDYLRLIVINRPDGTFYFRKCPKCAHKTKLKPIIGNIEGPGTDGKITLIVKPKNQFDKGA